MTDHAGFGWMLLVLGLVTAGVRLVWILASSIPWLGQLPGASASSGRTFASTSRW
jgi:hypothetical protein